MIISDGEGKTGRIWEAANSRVWILALRPDRRFLVSGSREGTVKVGA